MKDEHLLDRLRDVAVDRVCATPGNIRGAAALGKRMRRRRRAGAALGSGLTVAGFAALLTFASPTGQTVVESPEPASGGDATTAPSVNWCKPMDRVRAANFERVREILGSADWKLYAPSPQDACVHYGGLLLSPGSGAARGLPVGDTAQVGLQVRDDQPASASGCPSIQNGPASTSCATRQTADGHLVVVERTSLTRGNPVAAENTIVKYRGADGISVSISLVVDDPRGTETTARQHQAQTWLDNFDERLVGLVTDPSLAPDPDTPPASTAPVSVPTPASAAGRANLDRLHQHLGVDSWRPAATGGLEPVPGSADAAGLPASWTADADVSVQSGNYRTCTTPSPKPIMHCTTQTAPDGQTVQVWHTDFPSTQTYGGDELEVVFSRPDGKETDVLLRANWQPGQGSATTQQQAQTWLTGFLDRLIATAEDPAIVDDRPADTPG